ncbi:hypothetical protein BT67DRAFT_96405 [Trichocladium antarcticum]|uniref:RRM domain-containing protein n=1 Tax=Trichocladium antarcticum TaxID=1450529 RepID=A0AAN6UQ46_9PEZI|nr:hypothetical protein BT67DRAFT_96405 [Trichocladium antarcticum]
MRRASAGGRTKMHRNQHQDQNLTWVKVEPGTETGLYYIPVGNLAHSTTWKDLKAFAAQACDVDHAEVYSPTSGWVRVRGLANFEKAFKHLDGNILEYRALQADGRNKTQSTLVKLSPTDYHAVRINQGEAGGIVGKPPGPTPAPGAQAERIPQGDGPGGSTPYPGHQGNTSRAFTMSPPPNTQWAYASPILYAADGYYPSTANTYQTVADPAYGFSHQLVPSPAHTFTHPAVYQVTTGPASDTIPPATASYPYGTPMPYHPSGTCYSVGGVLPYTEYGNAQPPRRGSNHAYTPGGYSDVWPRPQNPTQSQNTMLDGSDSGSGSDGNMPAGVVIEQRKIILRNLDRAGLSEAAVRHLIAQHTGIAGGGPIERVEVRFNNDGRARGTAFVTFCAGPLARAVVAALDGCEVAAGRRISARFTTEGVSSSAAAAAAASSVAVAVTARGGFGSRPGRRVGTGGRAAAGGRGGGKPLRPARGHVSALRAAGSLPVVAGYGPAPAASAGGGGQKETKEEPPVVVDGSGGRKREMPPVVVDGSGGKRGQGCIPRV